MSLIKSPRGVRKPKHEPKNDVVAVHKTPTKRDASSDRETLRTGDSEESSGSNRTYNVREDNNRSVQHTPSRDVSVDGESQINSKIISLIESEIRREAKHTAFSDSRPQSLSFYEEEKLPEELTGNLELLSPEERRHYKNRKHHSHLESDERRENDETLAAALKKSKSRKKKHGGSCEIEIGIGDSREMMIPKEKRKSKKKKHESPISGKRKHRKREDDFDQRTEITLALEELQDDVFENHADDGSRGEKSKISPRRSERLYVQRKNRFEATLRDRDLPNMENHPIRQHFKGIASPLQSALSIQQYWRKFSNFCHGILGGLGFAHVVYLCANHFAADLASLRNYALYSGVYVTLFYVLSVICLLSVFDKYDVADVSRHGVKEFLKTRKSCFVIILYLLTLAIHLVTAPNDNQIALIAHNQNYTISDRELHTWVSLSFSRGLFAFIAWFFVSLTSPEDFLYTFLKSLDTTVEQDH